MEVNPSHDQADEQQHLAEEHGLRKTVAYVYLDQQDGKRSAAAKRQEKRRQKLKSEGLVSVLLPVDFAEGIKKCGTYEAWARKHEIVPILEYQRLKRARDVLASYESLPVWKRRFIYWIKWL